MALVKCAECGNQISDKASACPKCGAPMARPVTIEQTGKRHKTIQLIGVLLIVIGMVSCMAGVRGDSEPTAAIVGAGMAIVGLVLWFAGRIGAWWGHG